MKEYYEFPAFGHFLSIVMNKRIEINWLFHWQYSLCFLYLNCGRYWFSCKSPLNSQFCEFKYKFDSNISKVYKRYIKSKTHTLIYVYQKVYSSRLERMNFTEIFRSITHKFGSISQNRYFNGICCSHEIKISIYKYPNWLILIFSKWS